MNDPLYTLLQEKGLPVLSCSEGRVEFERLLTPAEAATYRVAKRQMDTLSRQKLRILELAALGNTNKMIALELGITVQTVKNHFQVIYERLGAVDRASAVAKAIRQGIL